MGTLSLADGGVDALGPVHAHKDALSPSSEPPLMRQQVVL